MATAPPFSSDATKVAHDHCKDPGKKASSTLMAAALVGLLGVTAATACASDGPNGAIDSNGNTGGRSGSGGSASSGSGGKSDEVYSNVVSTTEKTLTEFDQLCTDRGGFVTTHAQCAGSNLCKGLSYADDGTTLTDHSCKGMNACAGMSCVDLPEDSGLTGQEIYEAGPCAGCHNNASKGASTYVVFVRPGEDAAAILQTFETSPDSRLAAIVAFGTQGVYEDGTAFSNMPSYREQFSRAEIERVVAYLKGLEHPTVDYGVPAH